MVSLNSNLVKHPGYYSYEKLGCVISQHAQWVHIQCHPCLQVGINVPSHSASFFVLPVAVRASYQESDDILDKVARSMLVFEK